MEPDSPFETQVIKVLRNHNWVVHPQVGCSGYRIDMGIVDPRAPGRYLVGIECDGRAYHSGATARDRDRLRQVVLEGLGWRLHRIWSTDWWLNQGIEVQKLLARLDKELETDPDERLSVEVHPAEVTESEVATEPAPDNVAVPEVRPDDSSALREYQAVTPAGGKPDDFYELVHGRKLTEQLIEVIEGEGPIHESVLHRRIARAWGLERTGTRIVNRLRILTPRELGRTTEGDATFYWPSNSNPAEWTVFREASTEEASRRKVDDVCLEELANGVLHVLGQMGSAPNTDVAKSVCRLIGMARTPADAEARVGLAISRLVENGRVATSGSLLRLR
jgi:very-short-patch-repair endonuclease